jgi:hypothetical protein
MKRNRSTIIRLVVLLTLMASVGISSRMRADTGTCGGQMITLPFTDVLSSNIFFCSIGSAYFTGLTNGTSATTYSPADPVPREQMAAFVTRTLGQSLKRHTRRAALRQLWTTQVAKNLALTSVATGPKHVKSDGTDLWVAGFSTDKVSRVRASDGKLLANWTGASGPNAVLVAMGKVFVTGQTSSRGVLFEIDPTQPPGAVVTHEFGGSISPEGITFDGLRIWTANRPGSVSIITFNPFHASSVSTGFSSPHGILYDGTNIWVTDIGDDTLKKLDSAGNVLLSLSMGASAEPGFPAFDGTNIWVPTGFTVVVVRAVGALAGAVIATLSGNGLNLANQAAFDGERVLVTNRIGNSVSLWKASDLTPIGTFSTGSGTTPWGVCSDGVNFWITFNGTSKLARF